MDGKLKYLLTFFGFDAEKVKAEQIKREEDDTYYEVWRIFYKKGIFILKECKEFESDIYNTILKDVEYCVPKYFGTAVYEDKDFILIEYLEGESLIKSTREKITSFLDSLIYLQNKYWNNKTFNKVCYNVENSLNDRKTRGSFVKDERIDKYYEAYLDLYVRIPCTLCNDDMLPFNALYNKEKGLTYIIDWEESGILPYLNSFARFISHTEDDENAFFYMKEEDKAFAIEYYYQNLLKDKGITYSDYRDQLNLFMIYEYCEWIMLYNKYEDASFEMFEKYKAKSYKLIDEIENRI